MEPRSVTVCSTKTVLDRCLSVLWKVIAERWFELLGVLVIAWLGNELYFALHAATQDIGYLFGWLIGASKSPTVASVAPVIFGLLGVVVFASIAAILGSARHTVIGNRKNERHARLAIAGLVMNLVAVFAVAHFASWFIYHASLGIDRGTEVRESAREEEARAASPSPQQAD